MSFLRLVMPGVTMIAVTYGLARFSFGLLLPDITTSLDMSESVSGIVSALFYFAYCFTIVISTVLTARKGPRGMILMAGSSAFLGLLLMGITPNIWGLVLGVLLAGGSTGLVSPPYGAAISLWIAESKQGKANTWINSGTSFGIMLSGVGALLLTPHWRLTYLIYALLTLIMLLWNFYAIPKQEKSWVRLQKGSLSMRGIKGAVPLVVASVILGISTSAFWTFSRSFIETAGNYTDWQLSGFWIMIGLFGAFGGFSGSLVEKGGLSFAYKLGSLAIALSPLILAASPGNVLIAYSAAGLFGVSYIFLTGVLLVWGIRVFITNASLGIGVPFLLLAVGQVMGAALAGILIDQWSYTITFIIYGIAGIAAVLLGPKKQRKKRSSSDRFVNQKHLNYTVPDLR